MVLYLLKMKKIMDGCLSQEVHQILERIYQVHFNKCVEVIKKKHKEYNTYITHIYLHHSTQVPLQIIKECKNDK
jgi:hypothetical protein